ncbi:hypothetical protein ACMA5I_02435 [Paracoccaceae bacterium GXU_MW_L88]
MFCGWMDVAATGTQMALQAGDVMSCRIGRMALGQMGLAEMTEMMMEKPFAFAEALGDAQFAMFTGEAPAQIAVAALIPIQRTVARNVAHYRKG